MSWFYTSIGDELLPEDMAIVDDELIQKASALVGYESEKDFASRLADVIEENSFDNLQVAMEQKMLRKYAGDKENVILMDIICFEYILLEFKELIEWIYAPDDEFLVKREKAITAREKLVKTIQSGEIQNMGLEVAL